MNNEKNYSNAFVEILAYTAETVKALADANSVVGEKIEKDGIAVIPISKLSVGFAGGGADIENAAKGKRRQPVGAGAKVSRTPVTFLVIDDRGAHLIGIPEEPKTSKTAETVSAIAEQVKGFLQSAAEKKAQEKKEENVNETD